MDHKSFFREHGEQVIRLGFDPTDDFTTVERLYQAFKQRLIEETLVQTPRPDGKGETVFHIGRLTDITEPT